MSTNARAADSFGVGDGHFGALSVPSGTTTPNDYTTLTSQANGGSSSINVANPTGFSNGMLILLWRPAGFTGTPTLGDSDTAVDISTDVSGQWELARIQTISTNTFQLFGSLTNTYAVTGSQVVSVPEFTTVTIAAGASIGPKQNWNGVTGGIVAFFASTGIVLTAGGSITADGAGFQGGGVRTFDNSNLSCSGLGPNSVSDGTTQNANAASDKGERVTSVNYPTGAGIGAGNVANGGGGGDCEKTGGGGGSHDAKGGNGGTATFGSTPGTGGSPIAYSLLDHLTLGGGGGGGQQTLASQATAGARGGGAVFIRAGKDGLGKSITGTGLISANGASPGTVATAGGMGGGGGGGAIYLRLVGTTDTCAIQARGGAGGSTTANDVGGGGGGGGGKVLVQAQTNSCTISVIRGAGGTRGGGANSSNGFNGTDATADTPPVGPFCEPGAGGDTLCNSLFGASSPPKKRCNSTIPSGDNSCVQCLGDSDCSFDVNAARCDTATHTCVGCNSNAANNQQCYKFNSVGKPICNTGNGHCEKCGDSTECTINAAEGACKVLSGSTATCVPCVGDSDCSGTPSTPYCETTSNSCVACIDNTTKTCSRASQAPFCTGSFTCIACNSGVGDDSQCTGNPNGTQCLTGGALTGACRACNANSDCSGTPATPFCFIDAGTCVACLDNTTNTCNRATITPFCDVGSHTCEACNADAVADDSRCSGNPNGTQCLTTGSITGACRVCNADADCSGTPLTPRCDSDTGACVQCVIATQTADCPSTDPVCLAGSCTGCTVPGQCAGRGALDQCLASAGDCVDCLDNTNCLSDAAPLCNGSNACVACVDDTACTTNHGIKVHCETVNTNSRLGQCVECRSSNTHQDCTSNLAAQCDDNNACVACSADGQCNNSQHGTKIHCETVNTNGRTGQCVDCRSNNTSVDCTTDANPECKSTNTCGACTAESTCNNGQHSSNIHCEATGPQAGQCALCRLVPSPSPFPSPTPLQATDCGSSFDPLCTTAGAGANFCSNCTDNTQCTRFGTTFVCDIPTGDCVGCTNNGECLSASAPKCVSRSCTACVDDNDCTTHPGQLACANDDISTFPGQCRQCSFNNRTACTGPTPVCNFQVGTCQLCTVTFGDAGRDSTGCVANPDGTACEGGGTVVRCGCDDDSHCGGETANRLISGRICNTVNNTCTNGCSRAPGRNNCPTNQFCTSNDVTGATTGVCTIDCNFDVDCQTSMPTMPFCMAPDGDAGRGRCAGCRNDGDCSSASPVCQTTNKVCVECTSTRLEACSSGGKGAICLADETCGCNSDSDCGAVTSGRICDTTTTHKCVAGCRQTGGNGCPADLMCTSTGMTAGQCVTPNDMTLVADMSVPDAGPIDMGVPIDQGPIVSLSGGGFGCSFGGAASSLPSLSGLFLLLGLAGLVRRRRK